MTTITEGFVLHTMEVSTLNKATSKREPVGTVAIYVPTLATLGVKTDALIDGEGKPILDDDGIPQYADDTHNFVQNAIFASVKAQARNRLVGGTADLKAGNTIATDWEQLTAESVRTGGGAGLIIYREVQKLFKDWVKTLNKSNSAYSQITGLFDSKKQLAVSSATIKEKMKAYVEEFAGTLEADQLEKYMGSLQSILDICEEATIEADDF